ncbi:MAG: hypothetical protein KDA49_08540 [Rhodospirillaceae bacterium]|nr:hypothetical protein [Rhodospirillaceae bacterium]MCA8932504.1 hypothetical protein [Rhodospirillaceae bacterium]
MRVALVLGLWLAIACTPAQAGRMTDHEQVGAWETFTWFTDAGEFSYCAAVTTDQAGRELFISVGRDGLAFSIDAPGQRLQQGQVMPVMVHIDEQTVFAPVDARVFGQPGQNLLLVELGWDERIFPALRFGRQLTLISQQFGYDYGLAGAGPALEVMDRCAACYIGSPLPAAPAGTPPQACP